MQEIWKPIIGYENLYEVSNLGNVRRIWKNYKTLLKQYPIKGYLRVSLCKNGKQKWFMVHRLVGQAFVENPTNAPFINHKDENPLNNIYTNLEWCTAKYNINYGSRTAKTSKPVEAFDNDGNVVYTFKSMREARRNGFSDSEIILCIKRINKTHKGLHWRFVSNA